MLSSCRTLHHRGKVLNNSERIGDALSRGTHARRRRPIGQTREANTWKSVPLYVLLDITFIRTRRFIPMAVALQ